MKKVLLSLFVCCSLGTVAQAQIVNPGMENWQNYTAGFPPASLERPTNWYGTDSIIHNLSLLLAFSPEKQLSKSTDAHNGSFAARIITKEQGSLGNVPGLLMNAEPIIGIIDSSFAFEGGSLISGWVDSVYAWVNYAHTGAFPGDDNAQMSAYAFKSGAGVDGADSMVGSGEYLIAPTTGYTEVGIQIDYTSPLQPDKLVIVFSSSPFSVSSGLSFDGLPGSTLYVDDVSMVMSPVSVPTVISGSDKIVVYPNPAADMLHIDAAAVNSPLSLTVYNTAGQKVSAQGFEGQLQLNTSELATGTYFYLLRDSKGQQVSNGKFQIAR